jgi:dTDP-4-dehydrorhamnose reductase
MFVTGASGFLGRHLVRCAESTAWTVVAPNSHAMDIADRTETLAAITAAAPDVVVHLAYRKDDRRVIVDGTHHVAEAAATVQARLIHVSTDVVFAGRAAPYTEGDRPDPIIEYGRHKADAEVAVSQRAPDAVIVRTSLLYGTTDPSPFQLELAHGLRSGSSPMTFFSDEFRCPVHAADVADAIAALAAGLDASGPLHIAGPDAVSRVDYAQALARHAGLDGASLPTSTIADSGMVRPANVVLDTTRAASLGIACRALDEALST